MMKQILKKRVFAALLAIIMLPLSQAEAESLSNQEDIASKLSPYGDVLCDTDNQIILKSNEFKAAAALIADDQLRSDFQSTFDTVLSEECSKISKLNPNIDLSKDNNPTFKKDVMKDAVLESVEKLNARSETTALQQRVNGNSSKIQLLEEVISQQEKTIIIPKELNQLEYMVFGKEKSSDLSNENRLNALGDDFYKADSTALATYKGKTDITEKIDLLRKGLNQHNWKSDMYWVGASVMSVPNVNVVTTGISVHAYPWYARAIQANLWEQDDFLRRSSLYLDVAAVAGGGDFNGYTYSGPGYGFGIGFDIRAGFVLKAGVTYMKNTPIAGGGNGSYVFHPAFGITITREFLDILLGGGK